MAQSIEYPAYLIITQDDMEGGGAEMLTNVDAVPAIEEVADLLAIAW